MSKRKNRNQYWLNTLAETVNDPKKLHGWVFIVTLFSVASLLFSQTAIYMALKWKFSGHW
jgi:hypothetical protein